jgi:hypothetical protein
MIMVLAPHRATKAAARGVVTKEREGAAGPEGINGAAPAEAAEQ